MSNTSWNSASVCLTRHCVAMRCRKALPDILEKCREPKEIHGRNRKVRPDRHCRYSCLFLFDLLSSLFFTKNWMNYDQIVSHVRGGKNKINHLLSKAILTLRRATVGRWQLDVLVGGWHQATPCSRGVHRPWRPTPVTCYGFRENMVET